MSDQAKRGSEKMMSALVNKGNAATADDVKAALSIPTQGDWKLLRWKIRGIPPVYYEVEAALQIQPNELGEAVDRFVGTTGIKDIHILINGVPRVDLAEVAVTVVHGEARGQA